MKGILTAFILSIFVVGCVGDDGREVIGSYAPTPDATIAATADGEGTEGGEDVVDNDGEIGTDADSNLDTGE